MTPCHPVSAGPLPAAAAGTVALTLAVTPGTARPAPAAVHPGAVPTQAVGGSHLPRPPAKGTTQLVSERLSEKDESSPLVWMEPLRRPACSEVTERRRRVWAELSE